VSAVVLAVLAAGWVDAGAFKLKLEVKEQKLRVEVDAPGPVHFKLADAAMGRLRWAHQKQATLVADQIKEMLKDGQHDEPACHDSLAAQAAAALRRLGPIAAEDVSTPVSAKPGAPVAVELWTAGPVIKDIAVDGKELLLPEPVTLPAPQEWLALAGEPDLSIRNGTVLQRADIGGLGCFGVEGVLSVPGEWGPAPKVFTHKNVQLHHGNVVIDGKPVATLKLSSPAADTFAWVDEQHVGNRTVMVFTAEGPSRPRSPMSMCGAGTERDGVWLLLGPDGAVEKQQVVLVQSCFKSLDAKLQYDAKRPLDGVARAE
jgi:hypothetical protein